MIAADASIAVSAKLVRRIIVVTNDTLWAGALCRICGDVFFGCDVGVHRTAGAALESLAAETADLVITGLTFPDADGLTVLDPFRRRCRLLLIVSSRKDDWTMMTLRTARFDGFFDPHDDDLAVLERVLPRIAAGDAYFSLSVKDRLLAPKLASMLTEKLTAMEMKVFKVIGDGRTNAEAASELGMREMTVGTHRQNIRNKLGVRSTAKLVFEAVRLGIVDCNLRSRAENGS
ncbi:MAG: LuxR C-terminal-related transcriptional regulator [Opitutaceae bacterium]